MDMRAEVWSPLQNSAIWLAAWLWGHETTDELLDALTELGGRPECFDESPFIDLLALLRAETQELTSQPGARGEPLLRLILSGPGEAPTLPAGSESARAAAQSSAGAIVVRTNDPEASLVLIPHPRRSHTAWQVIREDQPLPSPAWLSPGEADALLTKATDESADLITASGYQSTALNNPRLTVGTLSDFYDTPGLPPATPPRAAKLFARADRVAAIIETVTDRINDHSLDPELLRLWRHIRQARMTGVAYSAAEFAR